MATQWIDIYTACADVLLEGNPGFSLGLITDEQFWTIAAEVLLDFCGKTGFAKKLLNVELDFGVQTYREPSVLGELQGAMASQSFIYESSDFFLSNANRAWSSALDIGNPESYRQDAIPTKMVQITPAPQSAGNDVICPSGAAGYGVIGAVAGFTDFTFTCDPSTPQGYGTIAGANGNPYLESWMQGWGTIGNLVPSTNNLTLQGTALPFNIDSIGPQTFVELVPDSLTPYLKYGILAAIFQKSDSELKDLQKGAYCASRYQEGINLMAAILCDVYQED